MTGEEQNVLSRIMLRIAVNEELTPSEQADWVIAIGKEFGLTPPQSRHQLAMAWLYFQLTQPGGTG